MEETTFKVGGIVVLKSGGPDMTIEKFVWDDFNQKPFPNKVTCVWFNDNNLNRDDFDTDSLNLK